MHALTHCTRRYHVGRGIGGGLGRGGESQTGAIREKKNAPHMHQQRNTITLEKSRSRPKFRRTTSSPSPRKWWAIYIIFFTLRVRPAALYKRVVHIKFCTRWLHVSIRIYP